MDGGRTLPGRRAGARRGAALALVAVGLGLAACRATQREDELPLAAVPPRGTLRVDRSTRIEPGERVRARDAAGAPAILIEDAHDVVIEDVRFEGWFGQRLASTPEAEDPADWLWPHDNDAGEWLARYGGAISATDGRHVTVRRCTGRRGQNGILLTRTKDSAVYDNDFSFLSGWGLALYRSSRNVVARNRFDYCVRGYSHGVYRRGQDSAGILMFERCTDNVVAFNSATHGGDGLFLFGGQDLVERGEAGAGGSDHNLFLGNDFSFAVANAFEGTFSDGNVVQGNRLDGSGQHGVWGGYSSRMVLAGNSIEGNLGGGVSIEHGQECVLYKNSIRGNEIGVELWWDPDPQFVEGPYGRVRDTDSRDHWLLSNELEDNERDLVLRSTSGLRFHDNRYAHPTRGGAMDLAADALRGEEPGAGFEQLWARVCDGFGQPGGELRDVGLARYPGEPPATLEAARRRVPPHLPGRSVPFEADLPTPGGLATIVIGEWGPWDFESGAPPPAAPRPGGLLADLAWSATWLDWSAGPDPIEDPSGWRALAELRPLATGTVVGPWSGPRAEVSSGAEERAPLPATHFGLLASARLALPQAGRYRLCVISDDGVRVRLDGQVALENWTWHPPTRDVVELELAAGTHELELEYFQIDGASALSVRLDLVDDARAPGEPPPSVPAR